MEFKNEINNECAFHINDKKGFCSPIEIVDKLKHFVENKVNTDKKISKRSALKILKLKYNCDTESCILNQYDVKQYISPSLVEDVLKQRFKPEGPRTTTEWLSNFDIDDVLSQIKKKYDDKKFFHIPFQMRDFEKTRTELAMMDWKKIYDDGHRTFGTVINTDFSTGNGIHWFAIFGDFLDNNKCFTVEYFNSSGEPPLPEVAEWMKKFKHSIQLHKPVKDVIATNIENQFDNHSCGPYSLYYIISRLDGVPYEWFRNNKIGDENMVLFRQYLFRDKADIK